MQAGKNPQPLFTSLRQVVMDLSRILLGNVLCAIAINGIMVPRHFVTGGITGLSLIVHREFPALTLGAVYTACNIPLFMLAWMAVGRRFFFYSLFGALSLSLTLTLVHVSVHLDDKMLCALLAGLISGAGVGITLRSPGSQGGIDILSVMLLKRFSISIGSTILAVNSIVLFMVGIFYSLESVLYTMIVLFVSSKMVSLVVTGLSQRKAVFIISRHWREINDEILTDIRRGVTVLNGMGGYSREEEHILYTVVTFGEIGHLKSIIKRIDPDAFVVFSNTLEVINYRIGNQPHW